MVWLVYKADFAQHAWLLPPSSKFAELQIRLTLFYTYNDFWSILQNNLHFLNHFLNLKLDLSLILSPIVSFFPQLESAGHQSSAQARFKDCNAQQIADWIKGHESTPLRLEGGKVSNPNLYLCWWMLWYTDSSPQDGDTGAAGSLVAEILHMSPFPVIVLSRREPPFLRLHPLSWND